MRCVLCDILSFFITKNNLKYSRLFFIPNSCFLIPTSYLTSIACTGQLSAAFLAQATLSWLITSDLPASFILKTSGHNEAQAPQPMQRS